MKARPIIIAGIIAFIGMLAWSFLGYTMVTTVPRDQFGDALRKQQDVALNSQMTRPAEPLPLALRTRFLKQTFRASAGIMEDRSDVLILNSGVAISNAQRMFEETVLAMSR